MKKETRILGIDDACFDKFNDKEALVIATVFRGGSWIDGVMSTLVEVDGDDATDKIIEMVNRCKFKPQLQCIMLDGIAVAGFNVVDVEKLSIETELPVIVVMRDYPEFEKIQNTLKKLGQAEKIRLLDKAGKIHKLDNIHIQIFGLDLEKAKELIKLSSTRSNIPEPVRVAHIIGRGVISGESRGRA
ncbi:DUF99 family protein [Candidatus Woesearchaeota archaeon]|nr:DUF99 family protein [Candidatus Woesearchaeota archaeon]